MTDHTTTPTAPLDLDAIAARADAATKGPWVAGPPSATEIPIRTQDGETVAAVRHHHQRDLTAVVANVAHIAAARQDIPALLAEVRRLRRLETAVERYADELYAQARTEPNDSLGLGLVRAADGVNDLLVQMTMTEATQGGESRG